MSLKIHVLADAASDQVGEMLKGTGLVSEGGDIDVDEAVRRMGVNAHDSIPKPWQDVIARARRRYQALSESSGSEEMTARHAQIKEKLMEWSERLAEYFNIKL